MASPNYHWLAAIPFFLAVLICYLPAIRGGFVWDDNYYVTGNPHLNSLAGLWRIWFKLGATPQYYPLVFTSFWFEYHLWGLMPLGYHLNNVLLHAGSAVLLWTVLLRLKVRGAWLAGLIFALHPVGVESVAWITERKNVLSTFFYLLASLALIRFYRLDSPAEPDWRDKPAWRTCALALVLFFCALLSKTVTCTLPAAILIVLWWKRGRVRIADLIPLIPFFIIGAAMGLITAWLEKNHVGAQGADWTLSPTGRVLVAGRIIWFYLGKLFWPASLTFIYPRWQIDTGAWWQYLFPLGVGGLMLALWLPRRKIGRGPLAALVFFVVSLAPALGFINVYPMRFSYVADHFQYLAMIGPLTLAGAAGAAALHRLPARQERAGLACLGILLAGVLGPLTWRLGYPYKDYESLWRANLAQNPKSWLAMHNLGFLLGERGMTDQAIDFYQQTLRENPRWADAHINLATHLEEQGKYDEARAHYEEAARLKPREPLIPFNMGVSMLRLERWKDAEMEFRKALAIDPDFRLAHEKLAGLLVLSDNPEEAIGHYQRALDDAKPDLLDDMAEAQALAGHFEAAIQTEQQALALARNAHNEPLAQAIEQRIQLYRSHRVDPAP